MGSCRQGVAGLQRALAAGIARALPTITAHVGRWLRTGGVPPPRGDASIRMIPVSPNSLLRPTTTPLQLPLRIHPPRQPKRNQTQNSQGQESYCDSSKNLTPHTPSSGIRKEKHVEASNNETHASSRRYHRLGVPTEIEPCSRLMPQQICVPVIRKHRKTPVHQRDATQSKAPDGPKHFRRTHEAVTSLRQGRLLRTSYWPHLIHHVAHQPERLDSDANSVTWTAVIVMRRAGPHQQRVAGPQRLLATRVTRVLAIMTAHAGRWLRTGGMPPPRNYAAGLMLPAGPSSLLRPTTTPLQLPLRIHRLRQPKRNQTQHSQSQEN